MTQFKTKRNKLTAYALACGYVENNGQTQLWREHGIYHVRRIINGERVFWLTFETLKAARKAMV